MYWLSRDDNLMLPFYCVGSYEVLMAEKSFLVAKNIIARFV